MQNEIKKQNIKCSECSVLSSYDTEEISIENVDFTIMRLDVCGHGYVIQLLDDRLKEKKEKVNALGKRIVMLDASGDHSGKGRTAKKFIAAQIAFQTGMAAAWKKYGHLVEEPPTPSLIKERV